MVQCGFTRAHSLARFGPNFCFDATAAYGSRRLAILKEEHLGATLLRRRATCSRDCGDYYAFTTLVMLFKPSEFARS